jgi:hypothetical protein
MTMGRRGLQLALVGVGAVPTTFGALGVLVRRAARRPESEFVVPVVIAPWQLAIRRAANAA